ncbi:sensor histidine kinase [Herbidospora sp. RD11066]
MTVRQWLFPLACGVWVVAFDPRHGWLLALLTPLPVALLPARPVAAASGLLGLVAVYVGLGGALDGPALVAPVLAGAFGLGRYSTRLAGAGWTAVAAGLVAWRQDAPSAVFSAIVLGGTVVFGVLVRRRTESARNAERALAETTARDPARVAAEVAAGERARLARETVALVREAVAAMHAHASRPGAGHAALTEVQRRGHSAVTDLRRLLGLLRREETAPESPPRSATPAGPWWPDVAASLVLAGLALAEHGGPLALVMVGAVVVRRVDPALACLAAVAATVAAIGWRMPMEGGFWLVGVDLMLAWAVGGSTSRRAWAALALLALARFAQVRLAAPGNEPLELALLALGAAAAYLWAERDREERAARAGTDRINAETRAMVAAAVREERLRVARDLHDVTSHAVGVMVVQAGAALALAGRDPAASARAVAEVGKAGAHALAELDLLARLLDTGDPGPEGDLSALIARMTASGLRIDHRLDLPPIGSPEVDRAVYRTVQEALTNVVRHAPGSDVTLTATTGAGMVEIRVGNTLPPGGSAHTESGFGLVGLAERVRALGGTLSAGPSGGTFTLLVRLPLEVPS